MRRKTIQIILAFTWLITCTILFTLPGSSFPSDNWWSKIPLFDKWVHIFLFSVLTYLVILTFINDVKSLPLPYFTILLIAFSCILYGIIIEIIQHYFIPLRSFDLGDIFADAVGILIGIFVLRVVQKIDPCKNRGRNQN